MWCCGFLLTLDVAVFSACAEMFLKKDGQRAFISRFLCVCRDVSLRVAPVSRLTQFSLRVQRCFLILKSDRDEERVFSACAEMFL